MPFVFSNKPEVDAHEVEAKATLHDFKA